MSDFNATIIAKSQKVLDQNEGVEATILEECTKQKDSLEPKDYAKSVMEALFRIQQIRPEYLASKNDLSDKIFESPEALEAFLAELKDYKDAEKNVLFSDAEEVGKEILDLDANAMFLNPQKIEEAKKFKPKDFVVGEDNDLDNKLDQEISPENVMKDIDISEEEIQDAPEELSNTQEPEEIEPEQENQKNTNQNFSDEVDFENSTNQEIRERLTGSEARKQKALLMKNILKDCNYSKKHKIFSDKETGRPFVRIEGMSWLSYIPMANKDKQYHSVTRASAGSRPSSDAMKAVLYMVEPKTIRQFPTENVEEAHANFKKALVEMKEEGFDLNEISISMSLNRKDPELKRILESVRNPKQEFTVGLSKAEVEAEKLKGEEAGLSYKEREELERQRKMEAEEAEQVAQQSNPTEQTDPNVAQSGQTNQPSESQQQESPVNNQEGMPQMDDIMYEQSHHNNSYPPEYDPSMNQQYDYPPQEYDPQNMPEMNYYEDYSGEAPSMGEAPTQGDNVGIDFDYLMSLNSDEFLDEGRKIQGGTYSRDQEIAVGERVIALAKEKGTTPMELVSPKSENHETDNLGEAMGNVLLKGTSDYMFSLKNNIENQEEALAQSVESDLKDEGNKKPQNKDQQRKNNRNKKSR